MPSTIQIVVSMQNANNFVTGSLNDTFNSQYGRHNTVAVPIANTFSTFAWPTSGETMLYIKFPQLGAPYTVNVVHDVAGPIPAAFTIPSGTGFVPVMVPKPPPAADGTTYYAIESSVALPTLPMFYF